ncbi:ankyrin repeat domain-containing protein [Devosia sp. YIM 151766]|uniref:ankyrin repeat domain-containing protein n=1 Tax=Devosia sp. YIM 151766 TaxID=3017325 RepID=UPI00255C9C06|nr:ankyrin repeat domain-containing protein [Devosia sp. YIM 151766]WIY52424.1 ankyrin repeat domain-containing protein [Devosia sp. YIM 151766]
MLALLRAIAILMGASTAALYPSQGVAQPVADPVAQTMVGQLQSAILRNDAEHLEAFSKVGLNLALLGDDGRRLMFLAAEEAQETTIDLLIGLGGDVQARNAMGYTLVMAALAAGNLENALLFRERGVKLDVLGHDGHSAETLAELIGAEGFDSGRTAPVLTLDQAQADRLLLLAVEHGDLEGINFALANGASLGASAVNGWSAVMLAALAGDEEILSLLVSELKRDGADGLASERNRTVGQDKFDVVLAALVGEGGGLEPDHQKVVELLGRLRTDLFDGDFPAERLRLYRSVAERMNYDPLIIDPALEPGADAGRSSDRLSSPEFLPEFEYYLPYAIADNQTGWWIVQTVLESEGLLEIVDDFPGPNTYSALLSYLEPLEQILADRAMEAMIRADNADSQPVPGAYFGYGEVGDSKGEYKIAIVDGTDRRIPAGYTGYIYYPDGGEPRYSFKFALDGGPQHCIVTNDDPDTRSRMFRCPLLNGVVTLTNTSSYDSTWLSLDFGSGEDSVLTLTNRSSPFQIPRPGGQ